MTPPKHQRGRDPRSSRPINRCKYRSKDVARAMGASGVGVNELARRLGVTHQAVSARIKEGLTPAMRDRYLAAIAETPNP